MKIIVFILVKIICYSIVLCRLPGIIHRRIKYERSSHERNGEFLGSLLEDGTDFIKDDYTIWGAQCGDILMAYPSTEIKTVDKISKDDTQPLNFHGGRTWITY